MATKNGLERIQYARKNIERLRGRREFLAGRIQARLVEGHPELVEGHPELAEHDIGEIRALDWALPVLEAEWDSLVRLRRDHGLSNGVVLEKVRRPGEPSIPR